MKMKRAFICIMIMAMPLYGCQKKNEDTHMNVTQSNEQSNVVVESEKETSATTADVESTAEQSDKVYVDDINYEAIDEKFNEIIESASSGTNGLLDNIDISEKYYIVYKEEDEVIGNGPDADDENTEEPQEVPEVPEADEVDEEQKKLEQELLSQVDPDVEVYEDEIGYYVLWQNLDFYNSDSKIVNINDIPYYISNAGRTAPTIATIRNHYTKDDFYRYQIVPAEAENQYLAYYKSYDDKITLSLRIVMRNNQVEDYEVILN